VTAAGRLAAHEASLRRRFRVTETEVQLAGRTLSIIHPASAEDLIDEREFERDERLPYWAELWPSARVLGEDVLGTAGRGRRLLELGCGAGLVATCASLAGFEVVASDYYEDATRFARVNAWRNGAPVPRTLLLDWRSLPGSIERFEVVVASDVLYERPYGTLVARAIRRTLSVGGLALVADPGRVGRDEFLDALATVGLEMRHRRAVPYVDGEINQSIAIFEIVRRK